MGVLPEKKITAYSTKGGTVLVSGKTVEKCASFFCGYFSGALLLDSKSLLGSAVAGALEDAEIGAPRADGVAVLVGHDAGDLVEMR
jgi:hypothetical protein